MSLPTVDEDEVEALEGAIRELDEEPEELLSENDAKDILMTLIRQKVNRPVQQFSYRQVQSMKNDIKNGRGFRGPNSNHNPGMKKDIQHLKSITKCRNCGMTGHWHRECPHPNKAVGKNGSSNAASSQSSNREGDNTSKAWWSLAASMDQEQTDHTTKHE